MAVHRLSQFLRPHAGAVLSALLCAFAAVPAHAQATRTWVSGVGDDANPCSRTAPCKTWAGAITKTAAGGEISALDPGAFGAVTITKAITLDGGAGQVASVLASGGSDGIRVVAGASDDVILRNVTLNGVGTGGNGVLFSSGRTLRLQNVKIERFAQACIAINTGAAVNAVQILDTTASNCANGLSVASSATTAAPPWAASVSVDRSRFLFNGTTGILASGQNAGVQVSGSTVFGNALGLSAVNQASLRSSGNNQTLGNTVNGSFTATAASN
ncbi:hypothetical protein [Paracidovorax anthurii]|uniref:Parallel beta helix pectate lyase-like protein n=1 Tax=Paracidovorax anthurii TaxID=78229 RepID=A0A328YT49_9BURK|nr:hypothetical protein [Paracidovorax anthurii]RAR75975.1 hypothetical protein AX018_105817 [Paracidovorax anthurii]